MGGGYSAGAANFLQRRKEFHGHAESDRRAAGIRARRAGYEHPLAHPYSDDRCRRARRRSEFAAKSGRPAAGEAGAPRVAGGHVWPHERLLRLPDALANLGDALLASGKTDRAKEIFEQLVDRDPENDSAKRKLNEALRKMGMKPADSKAAATPEPAVVEESLQAELPQPPVAKIRGGLHDDTPIVDAQAAGSGKSGLGEQELDEETQKFIAQSLTDVDLFASYGLTQKAIGLLEAILRRAPMHTPTLEKLLDFVLGAGDDRRTAELAAQLEHIHAGRGDLRSSERFGELRRRFQRAAGLSDEEIATAVAAAMPQPVDVQPVGQTETPPVAEVAAAPPTSAAHEI